MENEFWQVYDTQGVQTVGMDVWNGSESQVNNFANGGGRSITFPIGKNAGNQVSLDRHSFVILNSKHIVRFISPQSTHYTRRLDVHGQEMHTLIQQLISVTSVEDAIETPSSFQLYQNSPNPFTTLTRFQLNVTNFSTESATELAVYDLLGRKVTTISTGNLPIGKHTFTWNGKNRQGLKVPAGIYFLNFRAGKSVQTKRMVFLGN